MGNDNTKLREFMAKQTLVPAKSLQALDAESPFYMASHAEANARFVPNINYGNPAEFAFFGSAEQYYEDSIKRIANQYPFDGSLHEKTQWQLSSSFLDLWFFNHEYPKAVGSFVFSSDGWGSKADTDNNYQIPNAAEVEYIEIFGGPGTGDLYSESDNRGSSLLFDPAAGNTVEMWIKHDDFDNSTTGNREVIFDCYSAGQQNAGQLARIRLEYDTTIAGANDCLRFTYTSGSAANKGFSNVLLPGSRADIMTDNKWHHIAITTYQVEYDDGSIDLRADFYLDRDLEGQIVHVPDPALGSSNRNMVATIGSLVTAVGADGGKGYGKLDASLDEFRFWKTKRGPEEIGRNFQQEVHGGTDQDHTNAKLGIYYKFTYVI